MSVYFKKIMLIFLTMLPGVMIPELGFGELNPKDKQRGVDEREKEYKQWSAVENRQFESAKQSFFEHNKIDVSSPAHVLFRIKLDDETDKYLGVAEECKKVPVKDSANNDDLFRTIIWKCNQTQVPVPASSAVFADILKYRTYAENQELAWKGSKVAFITIPPPHFYTQWPNDATERFRNVLVVNLLGDLYRKTGSRDQRLKECIQGYQSDTLENVKVKLNGNQSVQTHGCEEFFTNLASSSEPGSSQAAGEIVPMTTSYEDIIKSPYERSIYRASFVKTAYALLENIEHDSKSKPACFEQGKAYFKTRIGTIDKKFKTAEEEFKFLTEAEEEFKFLTEEDKLTAQEARKFLEHFRTAYRIFKGEDLFTQNEVSPSPVKKTTITSLKELEKRAADFFAGSFQTAENVLRGGAHKIQTAATKALTAVRVRSQSADAQVVKSLDEESRTRSQSDPSAASSVVSSSLTTQPLSHHNCSPSSSEKLPDELTLLTQEKSDEHCSTNKQYLEKFLGFLPGVILEKDFPIEEWKKEFFPSTKQDQNSFLGTFFTSVFPSKESGEKASKDSHKSLISFLQSLWGLEEKESTNEVEKKIEKIRTGKNKPHDSRETGNKLAALLRKQSQAQNIIRDLHTSCQAGGLATKDPDWFWVMADRFFKAHGLEKQQEEWKKVSF